jgi:hypothetical protein
MSEAPDNEDIIDVIRKIEGATKGTDVGVLVSALAQLLASAIVLNGKNTGNAEELTNAIFDLIRERILLIQADPSLGRH